MPDIKLKYEPHEFQSAFHQSPKKIRLMLSGIRAGKCLKIDQKVLMADKTTKEAGDIRPGDKIMGISSGRVAPTKVNTVQRFSKEVFAYTLSDNSVIEFTSDHRFPCMNIETGLLFEYTIDIIDKSNGELVLLKYIGNKRTFVFIVEVEPLGMHECVDISINNQSKLYLLENGVATHNSMAGCAEGIRLAHAGWKTFKAPNVGCVVLPSYPMCRDVFVPLFLEMCPQSLIKRFNWAEMFCEFNNGSKVLFRSAEKPNRLRGLSLHWFHLDECRDMKESIYDIMCGRIAQKAGCGFLTTSAKIGWIFDKLVADYEKKKDKELDVIRFSSYNNPHFPIEEIERLKNLYTPDFFDQEIMGREVKFEGCIYKEFNKAIHVRTFGLAKITRFIIGLDFGYSNPCSFLVVGFDVEGNAYIVEEFFESGVISGDLIQHLKGAHREYAYNMIYADPSEPGYIKEIELAGLPICKANNAVNDGINKIRGLFKNRKIFISPKCTNLIRELEYYHYKKGTDTPVKVDDHACFVKGTKIHTNKGQVNIENIRIDDVVMTRKGWRKVTKAALSAKDAEIYEVKLSNGRVLRGTGNHPIFVKDKGFVPISALRYAYILESINNNSWYQKQKLSMGLNSENIGTKNTGGLHINLKWSPCTDIFGENIMARFRKNMSYTTLTETLITMKLKILNVFHTKNTNSDTQNILLQSESLQVNGMDQKKGLNGIGNLVSLRGRSANQLRKYARFVTSHIAILRCALRQGSAQIIANQLGEEKKESTMRKESVNYVRNRSTQTNMTIPDSVHVLAVRRTGEKEDVFNLTVDDQHEYYACGVLSANCDSLRYCLNSEKDETPESDDVVMS